MTIEFKTAEIPATNRSGRKAIPNPFTDIFPLDSEAREFIIAEPKDSTEAKRIVRQVRAAAKAVERTGRVEFTETDEGTKVTVWTVETIVRKPKGKGKGKVAPNPKVDREPVK